MTLEEQGAYMRLLCLSYPDGLPDDDDQLARLSGLGEGWFKGASSTLRACFHKRGKRLFNEVLEEEYKSYEKHIEKSRAGGIASGKARKQRKKSPKGGSAKVQPTSNQNRVEKSREEKSIKKEDIYMSEAEQLYEFYKKNVRAGSPGDAKRNIAKLLKQGISADTLHEAVTHYMNSSAFRGDKQYRVQANNFFGERAEWETYKDGPILLGDEDDSNPDLPWKNQALNPDGLNKLDWLKQNPEYYNE